jgi:hypothetical protein
VTHPADDDGIWFFRNGDVEVQIESSTGNCPFLIESNIQLERHTGNDVAGVIRLIAAQLGISPDLSTTMDKP